MTDTASPSDTRPREAPGGARELATAALAMARETGQRRVEPGPMLMLAEIDERGGRHHSALQRYQRAYVPAREVRNQYSHVEVLIGVGSVYLALGRRGQARHHLDKAVAISRRIGYRLLEEQAVAVLATLTHEGVS